MMVLLLATTVLSAPPGGVCKLQADCVTGTFCRRGTCELPGPCATTGWDGTNTYRYDAQLRETGWSHPNGRRSETVWKERTSVERTWRAGHENPNWTSVTRYDETGRVVDVVEQGQRTTYDWTGKCLAAATTSTSADGAVTWRARPQCDAAGRPQSVRAVDGDGKLVSIKKFEWDPHGRLLSIQTKYAMGSLVTILSFMRSAEGYIKSVTTSIGGTPHTDTWDLSCWNITASGVTRR